MMSGLIAYFKKMMKGKYKMKVSIKDKNLVIKADFKVDKLEHLAKWDKQNYAVNEMGKLDLMTGKSDLIEDLTADSDRSVITSSHKIVYYYGQTYDEDLFLEENIVDVVDNFSIIDDDGFYKVACDFNFNLSSEYPVRLFFVRISLEQSMPDNPLWCQVEDGNHLFPFYLKSGLYSSVSFPTLQLSLSRGTLLRFRITNAS